MKVENIIETARALSSTNVNGHIALGNAILEQETPEVSISAIWKAVESKIAVSRAMFYQARKFAILHKRVDISNVPVRDIIASLSFLFKDLDSNVPLWVENGHKVPEDHKHQKGGNGNGNGNGQAPENPEIDVLKKVARISEENQALHTEIEELKKTLDGWILAYNTAYAERAELAKALEVTTAYHEARMMELEKAMNPKPKVAKLRKKAA